MEIAKEIHNGHSQNLGTDETKCLLEVETEMSEEYLPDSEKTLACVFHNEGQVVPCRNTVSEAEYTDSIKLYQGFTDEKPDCLTVRQMQIDETSIRSPEKRTEVDDSCLENGKCLQSQQDEEQQESVFVMAKGDFYVKKFQWPAMGIRNEIHNERENDVGTNKPELHIKKHQWPLFTMKNEKVESVTGEPDLFQNPVFDENEEQYASSTLPVAAAHVRTASVHNPQPAMLANTTDALEVVVDEDEDNIEKCYTSHPSSIFKKESSLAREKKTSVHFPENMILVRLYDISDDDESDADTVLLSDDDDDDGLVVEDQQVPSNNFPESNCSLFVHDPDCISSNYSPSSSDVNVDFKPQFYFPPVRKIANYQLFNSPDEEEQMFENMEICVEEIQDDDTAIAISSECQDGDECGLNDDVPTATATSPFESKSEKLATVEEPLDIEYLKSRSPKSRNGVVDKTSCEGNTHQNQLDVYAVATPSEDESEQMITVQEPAEIAKGYFKAESQTGVIEETLAEDVNGHKPDVSVVLTTSSVKSITSEKIATEEEQIEIEYSRARAPESHAGVNEASSTEDTSTSKFDVPTVAAPLVDQPKSEKIATTEQLIEIEYSEACTPESHTGVNEANSADDTDGNYADSPEMDMGFCNNDSQTNDSKTVENVSSMGDCVKQIVGLEELEDVKIKMETGSIIPFKQDSASFLGRCGSRFLWRGRRTIDSMLIDEAFHASTMSTKSEIIRPILQTITEEVFNYSNEQIIDVVSHETNILKLSQGETKCTSSVPSQCHAGPEKHVIQALVSSPDHFDRFDLAWGSNLETCSAKEASVLKSTTDGLCIVTTQSKKDPAFENHQATACEVNKHERAIAVIGGAGGARSEYEYATNICSFEERKGMSFASDFYDKESQNSFSTTVSTKRGQPALVHVSLQERPTVSNGNECKRLKTDVVSSHSPQMHPLAKVPLQKRSLQIVPEIIKTSLIPRKRLDTQSSEATVPPEDDVMDVNTPFHLDAQSFEKCNISEDRTAYDSEPERGKIIDVLTEDEHNNQRNTNHFGELLGCGIQSTEHEYDVEFKQDLLPHTVKMTGDLSEGSMKGFHSVFKTATGLYSSGTHFLGKQGRKKLRVGLSKSTKIKPLHPYWSKNKMK